MEIDGNGWNDVDATVKQKSFWVQLKSMLCELNIESQYRKHYDQVGIYVHWLLCKKYNWWI